MTMIVLPKALQETQVPDNCRRDRLINTDKIWYRNCLSLCVLLSLTASLACTEIQWLSLNEEKKGKIGLARNYQESGHTEVSCDATIDDLTNKQSVNNITSNN